MASTRLAGVMPYAVFVAASGGFTAWVATDAVRPSGAEGSAGAAPAAVPEVRGMRAVAVVPSGDLLLEGLEPGLSRLAVEQRFATQPAVAVEPVDFSSGTPVLRSRYAVHLSRPFPPLMPQVGPEEFRPGPYAITLEFNGGMPDHPLIRAELAPAWR